MFQLTTLDALIFCGAAQEYMELTGVCQRDLLRTKAQQLVFFQTKGYLRVLGEENIF